MLRQATHIVFAFILLINTAGIQINSHYCGDYLASLSVYLDASPCCDREDGKSMMGCCHDESIVLQLDDDFVKENIQKFNVEADFSIVLPEYTFIADLFTLDNDYQLTYSDYSPPPLISDIPIEVQSFLL